MCYIEAYLGACDADDHGDKTSTYQDCTYLSVNFVTLQQRSIILFLSLGHR